MKRFLAVLTVVWLMLGIAWAHDAAADTTMYVHVSDDSHLNGRHSPTRDSAIEMRLHAGDAVTVCGIDGGWAKIKGGEAGTCWVSIHYLVTADAGDYTVTSNGRLRVRSTPDGSTIGWLKPGQRVDVLAIFGGWARTDIGWMMAEYLERRDD